MKEIIQQEVANAIKDHKYPRIGANLWDYSNKNAFKDYVTGVIKKEKIKKQGLVNPCFFYFKI
jgi:hypothetical protein